MEPARASIARLFQQNSDWLRHSLHQAFDWGGQLVPASGYRQDREDQLGSNRSQQQDQEKT